jgi:hypothetical protein
LNKNTIDLATLSKAIGGAYSGTLPQVLQQIKNGGGPAPSWSLLPGATPRTPNPIVKK